VQYPCPYWGGIIERLFDLMSRRGCTRGFFYNSSSSLFLERTKELKPNSVRIEPAQIIIVEEILLFAASEITQEVQRRIFPLLHVKAN